MTLEPVTEVGEFSATLSATVDPNGNAGTTATFSYSTDQQTWTVRPVHDGATDPGLDGGTDPVSISDLVDDLQPGTTYYARLEVSSPAGVVMSAVEQFTTDTVPVPETTVDPVTAAAGPNAHFTGTVDPNGFDTSYRFEVAVDDGTPAWEPFGAGDAGDGDEPVAVEADHDGLTAQTDYLVRLVATNPGGSGTSDPVAFSTAQAAPTVKVLPGSGRTTGTVRLNATIRANGLPTTYRFEWGTTAAYGNRAPAGGAASAGSGAARIRYSEVVNGLPRDTAIHYRVVAENALGTSASPDRVVRTLAADRAYEMVSPPDKNGFDVAVVNGVQTAPSGDSAAFISYGPYAKDVSAGGAMSPYVAVRGERNWSTKGVMPPQLNDLGLRSGGAQFLSEDLTRGLAYSKVALAPGAIAGATNIYVQDLVADELTYVGNTDQYFVYDPFNSGNLGAFKGADADFEHIFVGGFSPAGFGKLYEIVDGAVRPASVLPDGSETVGDIPITKDAAVGYSDLRAVVPDGSGYYFTAGEGSGPLYFREGGSRPRRSRCRTGPAIPALPSWPTSTRRVRTEASSSFRRYFR